MDRWARFVGRSLGNRSMKPVDIHFVEPRAWMGIWFCAALVVCTIAVSTGVQLWRDQQQQRAVLAESAQLRANLEEAQRGAQLKPVPEVNMRAANEVATARLLQRDWNALFDVIESPSLAEVRLIQLSVDAQTGQAMLEYELGRVEQAAQVTKALNGGAKSSSGQGAVWRLERVDASAQPNASGVPKARGLWRTVD